MEILSDLTNKRGMGPNIYGFRCPQRILKLAPHGQQGMIELLNVILLTCVCMCACVCVCMHACVHACMHAWVQARGQHQVFSSIFLQLSFWDRVSQMNVSLLIWGNGRAASPGLFPSLPPHLSSHMKIQALCCTCNLSEIQFEPRPIELVHQGRHWWNHLLGITAFIF